MNTYPYMPIDSLPIGCAIGELIIIVQYFHANAALSNFHLLRMSNEVITQLVTLSKF